MASLVSLPCRTDFSFLALSTLGLGTFSSCSPSPLLATLLLALEELLWALFPVGITGWILSISTTPGHSYRPNPFRSVGKKILFYVKWRFDVNNFAWLRLNDMIHWRYDVYIFNIKQAFNTLSFNSAFLNIKLYLPKSQNFLPIPIFPEFTFSKSFEFQIQ